MAGWVVDTPLLQVGRLERHLEQLFVLVLQLPWQVIVLAGTQFPAVLLWEDRLGGCLEKGALVLCPG